MHVIGVRDGQAKVLTEGKAKDFIKLPSGDYVKPIDISAIRVQTERADRATGQIVAKVHVQHRDSWFTVLFDREDDANAFAERLAILHEHVLYANKVVRGAAAAEELLDQIGVDPTTPPEATQ